MKVEALRPFNMGVLEPKGPMYNFSQAGEVLDIPDKEPYSEVIANAIENGFLKMVEKKLFDKVKVASKKEVKSDKSNK